MKKINIILLGIATSLGMATTSCELQSEVYDKISTSVFPKNEADLTSMLVGSVYAPFRSNHYEGLFTVNNRGVQIISDMCTDVATCRWTDTWWYEYLNVNFSTRNNEGSTLIYANNINNVTKMSNFIRICTESDLAPDLKEKAIAEARCGRGWLVYILYDFYGGIQFIDPEAIDKPFMTQNSPRSSAEYTSKFAEEDLIAAAKVLPYTIEHGSNDYGRFTRGTALTVLMHLYMHDKRWSDAAKVGRELMKPEYGYDLVKNYKDIFTMEGEGNKETIFACTEDQGINTQLWLEHVLPGVYPTTNDKIVNKWNGYRMPWNFYHTYDTNDKRLETIAASFVGTDRIKYSEKNPKEVLKLGPLPVKYSEDPSDTGDGSSIDWIVLRFADVLTLQAEALAREAGAPTPEAIALLNRVHERAGLIPYNASDFSGLEQFLDAILLERGHELFFEGWRRSDLIRHGKFIEYAKLYKNSRTAAPHMELFPIPQGFIDEGKGLVIQNPGY